MAQTKASQLVWLRNDLRLDDNPALALAAERGSIQVIFIATPSQWRAHHESEAKIGLKAASLVDLNQQFARLGIAFTVLQTHGFDEVPETLLQFCKKQHISDLWFNQETPLDERRRDDAVCDRLSAESIECHPQPLDLLVNVPVLTQQNEPYKVFTPYYRRWLQLLQECQKPPYEYPSPQGEALSVEPLKLSWARQYREDLWLSEEKDVQQKLQSFCKQRLKSYPRKRDFPALPATSTLSPYLSLGRLGPRRLLASLQYHCADQHMHWLDNDWLRELAWRDFYRQLMLHFPRLNRYKPFHLETDNIKWRNDDDKFVAWCEGRTGFPIIDAAMRQLNQTGWMHNRLRMLAASFLSKLLLTDWRRGEQYFMQQLIDGEFAANNGGWQWSASTGCDAAPYFRVFNPVKQSQQYDPQGTFIRRFVPELAELDDKSIHQPSDKQRKACQYPEPIIDYKSARQRAIDIFADLKHH